MSRFRNIKLSLFSDESLFDAEQESGLPLRLAYLGLFAITDKDGRFSWRPRTLKHSLLPHDELKFDAILEQLTVLGLISQDGDQGVIVGLQKVEST